MFARRSTRLWRKLGKKPRQSPADRLERKGLETHAVEGISEPLVSAGKLMKRWGAIFPP
jgi:hypothetical protein